MDYTPPTTADLRHLKDTLGYSSTQMAELASMADGNWRKYTGGTEPRTVNPHMLFFIAARLALPPEQIATVVAKMQEIGAQIDVADFVLPTARGTPAGNQASAAAA